MDITANTAAIASATADAIRLLPTRTIDPVLSGLLLSTTDDGIELAGTDREHAIRIDCSAMVHESGVVLVPARPLAETLRALDADRVRLLVEGNRLAIRTPRGRFALPLLTAELHPGVPPPPATAGTVDGKPFAAIAATVVAASARDDALPMFTGVRLRAEGDRLGLVATDRYRLAVASLPWQPATGDIDVLVPAAVLGEIARLAPDGPITVHADTDRVAFGWRARALSTALLATPFVNERRYLSAPLDAEVELAADDLTGAVKRVGLYADDRGAVRVELGDGEVRLRGDNVGVGEAEESIKATVHGRLDQSYRARYLLDALRAFAGKRVHIGLRRGLRATVCTAVDPDPAGVALSYVIAPILPATR